jgi:hypothetical protein
VVAKGQGTGIAPGEEMGRRLVRALEGIFSSRFYSYGSCSMLSVIMSGPAKFSMGELPHHPSPILSSTNIAFTAQGSLEAKV